MALSDKNYKIDFYRLAVWLIPKPLRQVKRVVFIKALFSGLLDGYNSFLKYRKAKLYQLTITGQVCYLEKLLNDRYDFTQRRIVIEDAVWFLPIFIFQDAELKPVGLYTDGENLPQALYTDGEAGLAKNDFVVLVPKSIAFNEDEMKSLINGYRAFGTKYKIERV